MSRPVVMAVIGFAALGVAGCAQTDPYLRPGVWQPIGSNTLNLAAMVERPSDLIRGRGTAGTPGVEAAPAVARFWAGRPARLPNTATSSVTSGTPVAQATGGIAGTTAAGAN